MSFKRFLVSLLLLGMCFLEASAAEQPDFLNEIGDDFLQKMQELQNSSGSENDTATKSDNKAADHIDSSSKSEENPSPQPQPFSSLSNLPQESHSTSDQDPSIDADKSSPPIADLPNLSDIVPSLPPQDNTQGPNPISGPPDLISKSPELEQKKDNQKDTELIKEEIKKEETKLQLQSTEKSGDIQAPSAQVTVSNPKSTESSDKSVIPQVNTSNKVLQEESLSTLNSTKTEQTSPVQIKIKDQKIKKSKEEKIKPTIQTSIEKKQTSPVVVTVGQDKASKDLKKIDMKNDRANKPKKEQVKKKSGLIKPAESQDTKYIKDINILKQNEEPLDDISNDKMEPFNEDNLIDLNIAPRIVYDYNSNILPSNISKSQYSEDNSHLPKVFFNSEYSKLLFVAVEEDNLGAVKALIGKGANINSAESKNGYTPLMTAVINHKNDILRYLIIKGSNFNKQDKNGRTALHLAMINDNSDAFQILSSAGADINVYDKYKKKALNYVKDKKSIARLAHSYNNFNTALYECSSLGILACVRLAFNEGGDINYINHLELNTPLMIAAMHGHKDIVNFLLIKDATPNKTNARGKNAAELARQNQYYDIADLIETKAIMIDLERTDKSIMQYSKPDLLPQKTTVSSPKPAECFQCSSKPVL